MKIRFAAIDDIPVMVELGRKVHAESRFSAVPYDAEKLNAGLRHLIELQEKRKTHCCLLAENAQGQIIGGFIGALEEYFFSRSLSANSILIWVDPAYRGSAAALRLIDAFRLWGERSGAMEASIQIASGVNIGRTDRFLRRLGFSQTGGNYAAQFAAAAPEGVAGKRKSPSKT